MKKTVIIISAILLIAIVISIIGVSENSKKIALINQINKQYEQYSDKELYGTDVMTLINKAINQNYKNNVSKDEKDNYIDNNQNSITIDIIMITNEQTKETTTYRMETINKVGTAEFIANFNTSKFKITKIDYHKQTGRIKHIEITQSRY